MPDSTPTPAPASPATKTPHTVRGVVNQSFLGELTTAEALVRTAQKPEHAAALAAGEITAAFLTSLLADIAAARAMAATAASKTTSHQVANAGEQKAQEALTSLLHSVQARARQKFADTSPQRLRDYFIGDRQKIDSSRAGLEQAAEAVMKNLTTDSLPGIGTQTTADIAVALQAYKRAQTDQVTEQAGATGARSDLFAAMAGIVARRRKIQFAADATWPHENPTHAAIRREFLLAPDKALKA